MFSDYFLLFFGARQRVNLNEISVQYDVPGKAI